MSITYFVLNIFLLILGIKILGTSFGGKTIYAIVMLSIVPKFIPTEFINEFALPSSKLICTILGGILEGIGLPISQGGSTGGTDISGKGHPHHRHNGDHASLLFPSYTESGELLGWSDKIANIVFGLIQVTVCDEAFWPSTGTQASISATRSISQRF